MNISFDIDSTLMQSDQVRELAKLLSHIRRNLERGHLLLNVVMITDRTSEEWEYDYNFKKLVDSFGFSMNDVYFTDGRDKMELLKELGIDVHMDADPSVVAEINREFPGRGWLINYVGQMQD